MSTSSLVIMSQTASLIVSLLTLCERVSGEETMTHEYRPRSDPRCLFSGAANRRTASDCCPRSSATAGNDCGASSHLLYAGPAAGSHRETGGPRSTRSDDRQYHPRRRLRHHCSQARLLAAASFAAAPRANVLYIMYELVACISYVARRAAPCTPAAADSTVALLDESDREVLVCVALRARSPFFCTSSRG